MAQELSDKAKFWCELDELGEEQVRVRLATGRYGNSTDERRLVQEWLLRQSDERAAVRRLAEEQLKHQELVIVRSARKALWTSAALSGIAVLISLVALYFSLR